MVVVAKDRKLVAQLLASELKTARRNGTFNDSQLQRAADRLGVATPADWISTRLPSLAANDIRYEALRRAIESGYLPEDADLTSRRKRFSEEHGISPRTAARYEDLAIEQLAERVVDEAIKQANRKGRVFLSQEEGNDFKVEDWSGLIDSIDGMSGREALDVQRQITEMLGSLLDRLAKQDEVIATQQAVRQETLDQINELNAVISRLQQRVAEQIR